MSHNSAESIRVLATREAMERSAHIRYYALWPYTLWHLAFHLAATNFFENQNRRNSSITYVLRKN